MKPGPRPKGAPLVADVTLAAVTREWSSLEEIAARVDGWATETVKNNLNFLAEANLVEKCVSRRPGWRVHRSEYRLRLPEAKDG